MATFAMLLTACFVAHAVGHGNTIFPPSRNAADRFLIQSVLVLRSFSPNVAAVFIFPQCLHANATSVTRVLLQSRARRAHVLVSPTRNDKHRLISIP